MKVLKVFVPVLVVLAMLVVALPAGAQGPVKAATGGDGMKTVFVRTAGTNEDPFGGLPISTSSGLGSASKFGVGGPGVFAAPGGKPSDKSGDGTTPRKSVYVGGAWAAGPSVGGMVGYRAANENPVELPSCVTIKSPAGTSRWFKMDTWKNKKLQVWLDDELNTATAPSGSAVFGAGDSYMWGLNAQSAWVKNGWDIYPWVGESWVEGWVMAIYDPNNMRPNFEYEPPNAALYTTNNVRNRFLVSQSGVIGESSIHGYGEYNPNQKSHLLWYEGNFDGWVHARVYNQMIWDGVVTVCSYRAAK